MDYGSYMSYSTIWLIEDLSLLQHDSEESQAGHGKDMHGRNPIL
jgi:hypothetical protein